MITFPDSPDTVSPDDVDQKQVTTASRQLAGVLAGRKRKSYRLTIDGEVCDIGEGHRYLFSDVSGEKIPPRKPVGA